MANEVILVQNQSLTLKFVHMADNNNNESGDDLYKGIGRTDVSDQYFVDSISKKCLDNHNFYGVVALRKRFTKVDFQHSRFDRCVFRRCIFDCCDFNDCRFSDSDLAGSTFIGCRMDYATFVKTRVDVEVLENASPERENLKMRFARSLRKNYESLGNSDSVNRAVLVELEATKSHLKKGWRSKEKYYRNKYKGFERFKIFLIWLFFCFSDHIWGNGEKPQKLLRTLFEVFLVMALLDAFVFSATQENKGFLVSILESASVFLGVNHPGYLPTTYLSFIAFIKFIFFGLLISILVKKLDRR